MIQYSHNNNTIKDNTGANMNIHDIAHKNNNVKPIPALQGMRELINQLKKLKQEQNEVK